MESGLYNLIKRVMDIFIAISCLIFLSPLYIATALIIWSQDFHNPFYHHKRVGKNQELFDFYKFRSMVANADAMLKTHPELYAQLRSGNNKIKDDPRVTNFGKFIRKYSIDELPQMVNVLKGDMSIVGPRALRPDEYKMYEEKNADNKRRLEIATSVKPGITGYWQVNGRSEVEFGKRIDMDCLYATRKSVLLDLVILLKTPLAIFNTKGSAGY